MNNETNNNIDLFFGFYSDGKEGGSDGKEGSKDSHKDGKEGLNLLNSHLDTELDYRF